MGLSTKAFFLLEQIVEAHAQLADLIAPKVFYWLYALLTGSL